MSVTPIPATAVELNPLTEKKDAPMMIANPTRSIWILKPSHWSGIFQAQDRIREFEFDSNNATFFKVALTPDRQQEFISLLNDPKTLQGFRNFSLTVSLASLLIYLTIIVYTATKLFTREKLDILEYTYYAILRVSVWVIVVTFILLSQFQTKFTTVVV